MPCLVPALTSHIDNELPGHRGKFDDQPTARFDRRELKIGIKDVQEFDGIRQIRIARGLREAAIASGAKGHLRRQVSLIRGRSPFYVGKNLTNQSKRRIRLFGNSCR